MKKVLLLFGLFLAGCQVTPTPNDFPPPPTTIAIMPPPITETVEFPTVAVTTPTFEPRKEPVTFEKMTDARAFFQILYANIASGNSDGVADSIHYPIQVKINNMVTNIPSRVLFLAYYDSIINKEIIFALAKYTEDNLVSLPDGVRVGQGEIWFDLFCTDEACIESRFLITQINN